MVSLKQIEESHPDLCFLKADGFDDCLLGVTVDAGLLVYDVNAMAERLEKDDGMSADEAMEYLLYNTLFAYVGDKTPLYVWTE
jgi:hypothetical protein